MSDAQSIGLSQVLLYANIALASASVALVIVTGIYAWLTRRLAVSAEEQIRLHKTPNLILEVRAQRQLWLGNLGDFATLVRTIALELLDQDGRPIATRRVFVHDMLGIDESPLFDWKHIIRCNADHEIRYSLTHLSGNVRLTFYFAYGSTGQRTHALESQMRFSQEGIEVQEQHLLLNTELPRRRTLAERMRASQPRD